MIFQTILFYVFAAVLLGSAIVIITTRNLVHAVLCMVLCFFTSAALWLLLTAEFLAIVLVLVYAGAVTVLFLFVVMMLDIYLERLREGIWKNLPLAAAVGVLMAAEMVAVITARYYEAAPQPPVPGPHYSNTRELGLLLYTRYAYAFEIAAVILLVAIVAAIALTLRQRKGTKYQKPSQQIRVRREDRVKLVAMPPEKES